MNANGTHPIYYSVAILVAGLAVAGIFMLNHYQAAEERRQEEEARQREVERRVVEERLEQARREELRKTEEERKRQDELRKQELLKRQAEVQKVEEERKRAKEEERLKRVAAEKAQLQMQRTEEEALRKYREILDRVRFLRVDFLRNCPEESRPQFVKEERTYGCIVPKGRGRVEVLYLVAAPEKEMVIERYAETGERSSISLEEFNAMTNTFPCLIMLNDRGWICGGQKTSAGIPVVNESTSINPAREELGALYDFLLSHSAKMPDVGFSVYFEDRKGNRKLVRRINFGGSVSAYEAKRIVREELQGKDNAMRIGERSRSRSHSNRPSGECLAVPDWKVEEILCSGRLCYSTEENPIEGQEEVGEQKEDVAALKRKVAENLREIKRLRRENPACVLRPADGNIRNVIMRRVSKKDRRYYECMEVKYVREHFYCTGCDIEHDDGHCRSSRTAYPNWRAVREKVDVTLEINEKIDALYAENEELSRRLSQAEESTKRQ